MCVDNAAMVHWDNCEEPMRWPQDVGSLSGLLRYKHVANLGAWASGFKVVGVRRLGVGLGGIMLFEAFASLFLYRRLSRVSVLLYLKLGINAAL